MFRTANVYIRNNKAYVPATAQLEAGPYMQVAPVCITNLDVEEVTQALEAVFSLGYPVIPTPTREEMAKRVDPLLAATGVRSWKALARDSLAYGINWTDDNLAIYLPEIDSKGRFAALTTSSPMIKLPASTSIRQLAIAILNDVTSRYGLTTI